MTSIPDSSNFSVIKTYDEGFPLLMPSWGYVASAFVLFLIGFFGFFLNLMVILLMFKDRQLWTPLNIILFNLVCSDFSVSVLGNPFTLISALFHRWIFGRTMCVLYGFFMALLGITSITTLTVISFERYMMVTRPLSSRHLSSKGAIVSILFIWTYSLALTTPPLMGWGNYVNEAANISCSVNWHEHSLNALTYILFLFAMGQIVPMTIITYSYVNIIRTLRKNSQRLGRVSRAEARATAMVFIMIVSFTVAWTPYSVFALLEQFTPTGTVSPGAGVIPALVAKSSICYDPLIYVGMNTQFRQSIKRIFSVHTKEASDGRRFNTNTMVSPAHRLSSLNTRINSSELTVSQVPRKDKRNFLDNEVSVTNNEAQRNVTKGFELGTIIENRNSGAERSGETVFDDECSSQKRLEVFGESCQINQQKSPVLTIINTERLLFTKTDINIEDNVFGNAAYEVHPTDICNVKTEYQTRPRLMKQSYSLDLSRYSCDTKRRKLSVGTKLENVTQQKGFFKDTFNTFFEPKQKHEDCYKSYLCDRQSSSGAGSSGKVQL